MKEPEPGFVDVASPQKDEDVGRLDNVDFV
jgi:hypothetical protein